MKKILAISASNQKNSINKDLLQASVNLLTVSEVEFLLLSQIDLPLYSLENEKTSGIPEFALLIYEKMKTVDGFILACPEHNGLPPACFKNLIDWLSRIHQNLFHNRNVLLLSTSPGAYGGNSNLQILEKLLPRWGGNITEVFSLGNFYEQFDQEYKVIRDKKLMQQLTSAVINFENSIQKHQMAA
jgi:NAD(P)H-dependent FMN reductase